MVALGGFYQPWGFSGTALEFIKASGMKRAAGGRVDRIRDIALHRKRLCSAMGIG